MMSSPDDSNVSRSGRVRKKSSKLMDFQSPDEVTESSRQKKTVRRDDTSGSIFDPDTDSDVELGGVDPDLDMDVDQFDLKLEELNNMQDFDEDDFAETTNRTEIVKKPMNLPQLEDRRANTRISPFLLWAKHIKPEVIRENPGMGPSHMKVKLAELWNTVPKAEKLAWSKKAKRLVAKSLSPNKASLLSPNAASTKSPLGSPQEIRSIPLPGIGKVNETDAINIASHLKLLGESLSVIGERLTEHEGQIAVSGSLSVLLDSLLCAMGPLICLTSRVPELNGADPQELNQILDNVAYIMPGL